MPTALLILLLTAAAAILYLALARHISQIVDFFLPGPPIPHPTDPMSIQFDPDGISSHFTLGSWNWPFSWPDAPGPIDLKILLSSQNHLLLRAGDHTFTLGPVQKMWTGSKPQYEFVPAPGDIVTFTRHIARLPWPTPFTFNVLGGSVPKFKRRAHDRLLWTKSSGSTLEIIWRTEYWHYRRTGWADQCMNRLTTVRIIPSGIEKSAAAYLKKIKGWSASEYRLEVESPTSEDVVVNVIYLKDESAAAHPGAGHSVVLRISKSSGKAIGETGWQ